MRIESTGMGGKCAAIIVCPAISLQQTFLFADFHVRTLTWPPNSKETIK
jgi:hypothetical protein